jgi:hypothetical protein
MISTVNNNAPADLFRQAMDTFESAVKAGITLQEESTTRCTNILRDFGSPAQWDTVVPAQITKAIAAAQQNIEQTIRVMNDNAQRAMNLMETAFQVHRSNGEQTDDGNGDLWRYALDAMKANTDVIQQANSRVLDTWTQLAKEVTHRVEVMIDEVTRATEKAMQQV